MKKVGISLAVAVVLGIAIFTAVQVGNKTEPVFTLVEGERPTWDFEGIFEASEELILRAETEQERLRGLLGSDEISEYDIHVGVAEQYSLLGEGKNAYNELLVAINLDETRYLAFMNLGNLLGKVKAPKSAKIAYEMGLDRNDTVSNRINYIQHLEQYFGNDLDLVESSHVFALEKFPNSTILKTRYESWKKIHDR